MKIYYNNIKLIITIKEEFRASWQSFLGDLSKFHVWGPNTITMCSFTPNPYFACSLARIVYILFIPSQPVISQPDAVLKPY